MKVHRSMILGLGFIGIIAVIFILAGPLYGYPVLVPIGFSFLVAIALLVWSEYLPEKEKES